VYENEDEIGKGIEKALKDKLVQRSELFVVTKIWMSDFKDPEKALKSQLASLRVDYVDMYLVHWPLREFDQKTSAYDKVPTHKLWANMESLVKKGLTKSIGVSNFNVQLLMDMLTYCEIRPAINQIEFHPYLQQTDLVSFCKKFNIEIMAYNSLCLGAYVSDDNKNEYNLLKDKIVVELAKKYSKSEAQIVLNWAICKNIIVIPKTSSFKRIRENYDSVSFRLSGEDEKRLDKLECGRRMNNLVIEHFGNANIFA